MVFIKGKQHKFLGLYNMRYIYIDTMIQVFGAKFFEELIAFFGHSFAIYIILNDLMAVSPANELKLHQER